MTPDELTTYLSQLVSNNIHRSTMIWGAPGIGKSSIVRQVAEDHDLAFIDVRLSQLAPTDLRGLPVPDNGITRWFAPEFLPRDGNGILFLDEINMAPPAMQGVAQQLILDREVGSYRVPDGWFIWSAGNRKQDRASVFDMPAPLANRFIHLEVEPAIESFRQYAFRKGLPDSLIAFLAFRQDLLHQFHDEEMAWPSPRSWEMASCLHAAELDIAPAVGVGAAAEFYAYLEITEKIPDTAAIVGGKSKESFPHEVSLRYATVMSLVALSDSADHAIAALSWLVAQAEAEWVQLYATDAFPLLRSRGLMEAVQQRILQQQDLREFLNEFMALLAG